MSQVLFSSYFKRHFSPKSHEASPVLRDFNAGLIGLGVAVFLTIDLALSALTSSLTSDAFLRKTPFFRDARKLVRQRAIESLVMGYQFG